MCRKAVDQLIVLISNFSFTFHYFSESDFVAVVVRAEINVMNGKSALIVLIALIAATHVSRMSWIIIVIVIVVIVN